MWRRVGWSVDISSYFSLKLQIRRHMPRNRSCEIMRSQVRPDCVVLYFLLLGVLYDAHVWIMCRDSTCCATWCQRLYGRPYFHEIHCKGSLHKLVDRAWASWKSAHCHSLPHFLADLDETRYSSSSPRNSVEQLFGAEQLNGTSLSHCGQVEIGAVRWLRTVRSRCDMG